MSEPSRKTGECTAYFVGEFREEKLKALALAIMRWGERQEKKRKAEGDWRKKPRKRKLTPPR